MARPKKVVEVPGQETKTDEIDTTLENSLTGTATIQQVTGIANTAAELNAATAGITAITETGTTPIIGTDPAQGDSTAVVTVDLTARNAALSELNAEGFGIISAFEEYGFVDEIGRPLTNNLDFLELVKRATTAPVATAATLHGRAAAMVVNEDGAQRAALGKPVLTKDGWHIPG